MYDRHIIKCKSELKRKSYNTMDWHCSLSIEKFKYLCHFGCKIKAKSKAEINEHYWHSHTDEELALWSMNRRLLNPIYKDNINVEVGKVSDNEEIIPEKNKNKKYVKAHFFRTKE